MHDTKKCVVINNFYFRHHDASIEVFSGLLLTIRVHCTIALEIIVL